MEPQQTDTQQPKTFNVTGAAQVGFGVLEKCVSRALVTMLENAQRKGLDAPPSQTQYFPGRGNVAFSYFERQLVDIFEWLFRSKEDANFTYDITERNKSYLSSLLSIVTQTPATTCRGYIDELNQDQMLKDHVKSVILGRPDEPADTNAAYGRRVGWYVIARALKPRTIVETGVDKGLGSLVLSSALMRNAKEGFPGRYFGTDINRSAGYMFSGAYRDFGTILYGDSIETLKTFEHPIDLFINDSDHSSDYEMREYQTIEHKLAPHAVVLGDNAHTNDRLHNFAMTSNRKFVFFPEAPENHWYPGAGIGIAWK